MSDWRSRIEPTIQLTSPSGQLFTAYWQGGTRTTEKKLGIFEYPKVRGAHVQDLDVGGMKVPLTFFFEGPDHDRTARQFYAACSERGPWTILHPSWGYLTLQLMSVTEECQPVTQANITQITSEWIEPMTDAVTLSAPEIAAQITQETEDCNAESGGRFLGTMDYPQPSPGKLAQLKASLATFRTNLNRVKLTIAGVSSMISQSRNAILQTAQGLVGDLVSFGGAVQSLVATPGLLIRDIEARFVYYESIIADAGLLNPPLPTPAGLAAVALHDLVATTALTSLARTMLDAEFTTRDEALAYADRFRRAYFTLTDGLDAAQTLYADQPINRRYVNRTNLTRLVHYVTALTLRRSFDLATARRIRLTTDRAPMEIAITEDVELDTFIRTNRLQGDEVLLLRAGREVVVYQ